MFTFKMPFYLNKLISICT